MFQKAGSTMPVVIFIGVGVLSGIIALVLQVMLTPESHVKRVLTQLNWPVDRTITWYAHMFHNGNTDQLIPQGVLLWGLYWLIIGAVLGLIGYGIWRYFAGGP